MLTWKEKHHDGWLKKERYLYRKINQREMKQSVTAPLHVSLWSGNFWQMITDKIYGSLENEGIYQKSRKDAEGSQTVLGTSYT